MIYLKNINLKDHSEKYESKLKQSKKYKTYIFYFRIDFETKI